MFPFTGLMSHSVAGIALPPVSTVYDATIEPATVTAGMEFQRDGALEKFDSEGPRGESALFWMDPVYRTPTIGDEYEISATIVPGPHTNATPAGDALDTWLPLSQLRAWYFSFSGTVNRKCRLDVTIREIANPDNITDVMDLRLWIESEP